MQQSCAPKTSAQYASASAALTPLTPSTKNSLRVSGFGGSASEATAGADLRSGGAECRPPRSTTLDGDLICSCLAAVSPEGALCRPSREGALSSLGAGPSRRPLSFFFRSQPRFLGLERTVGSSLGPSGATLLMELQKPIPSADVPQFQNAPSPIPKQLRALRVKSGHPHMALSQTKSVR